MAWTGKTAVVTGIARPTGIGHACAHLLHQQGYNIIGIDTLAPPAGTAAPQPTAAGAAAAGGPLLPWRILQQQQQQEEESAGGPPSCVFLQVDLSQPAAILQDIPQQLQGLGVASVKTLVNNAGIADPYLPPPAADGSNAGERAALWSKYIAVNLSAPFLLTEALLPLLSGPQGAAGSGLPQPNGGSSSSSSIIHIASTRALQSEPNSEGYAAAKAGLLGLTHAQAASLAPRGIRVNVVLPGWIDTSAEDGGSNGGSAAGGGAGGGAGGLRAEDHAWHWAGRVGVPSDVAEMVAFLADEGRAGFITGQQFVVDGGVTKRMTYPE